MKKFIKINLQGAPKKSELLAVLENKYSDFQWRSGDSDQQGPYISGRKSDGSQIKFWLDDYPVVVSISLPALSKEDQLSIAETKFVDGFKSFLSSYGNVF